MEAGVVSGIEIVVCVFAPFVAARVVELDDGISKLLRMMFPLSPSSEVIPVFVEDGTVAVNVGTAALSVVSLEVEEVTRERFAGVAELFSIRV